MNKEREIEIKESAKQHTLAILLCMLGIDIIVGGLLIIFIVARAIG